MPIWLAIGAIVLGALSLLCTVGNLALLVRFALERQTGSMIPLLGGLLGAVVVLVVGGGWLALIPIVVDPASGLTAIALIVHVVRSRRARP